MEPTNNENSAGPVIAIVIVLVMIILGGLYFLGERNGGTETDMNAVTSENVDQVTASIQAQSSSDESAAIEEDLDSTNVDNLDSGLGDL